MYTIFLAVGLVLLLIAFLMLQKSFSFIKQGQKTKATVVDLINYRNSDGHLMYKPVYQFVTTHNEEIIYESSVASNPPARQVGDEVSVIYDRNNPQSMVVVSYFGLFSWTIILTAVAMPFIVIGGGYFLALPYFK